MWEFQLIPFVIAIILALLSPFFGRFERDRVIASIREEFSEEDTPEQLLENLIDHFQYSHDLIEMLIMFIIAIFAVLALRLSETGRLVIIDIVLIAVLFFALLLFVSGFRHGTAHQYCTNLKLKYYRFVPFITLLVNLVVIGLLVIEHLLFI